MTHAPRSPGFPDKPHSPDPTACHAASVPPSASARQRASRSVMTDPRAAHYFIDNMATTGTTLFACRTALGHGNAIVYADKHRP